MWQARDPRSGAVVVATVVAAGWAGYRRWVRPWHEGWGATEAECSMSLPGDGLVADPADRVTRAITVDAPPEAVWPWLVQMGADRGGFYTYDALENLFGLGIHSADEIVPEWQDLAVGDVVYGNRARSGGWYVVGLHPHQALVLQTGELEAGRPLRRDEQLGWEFVWIFALVATPSGATRVLVREVTAIDRPITRVLMSPLGLVSFVMTRGTLRGIKARVEVRA